MREYSWCFLKLLVIGCLMALSSCRASEAKPADGGSGGIKIDNIYYMGYLARDCGCALQYSQEWDRLSDRVLFLSSFRTGEARMNINGYDIELGECQTIKPRGDLRRGDHFFTDYRVTRILDRPVIFRRYPGETDRRYPDYYYPELGPRYPDEYYPETGPRSPDGYYPETGRRSPDGYYPESSSRYPRDDDRRRDQRDDNRRTPSDDYSPQPGVIYAPGNRLQDGPDYNRDRDSRPRRESYPWPEFSAIDVRVEIFVVDRCRRWEDPRCRMNYVDGKI